MHLLKGLVYSNVFVAIVLAALSLSSYLVVDGLSIRWYVPCSVFLGSFVLYSFHRLYKIEAIPDNQLAERHRWILKHAGTMKVMMGLAVFSAMVLLPHFTADTIVWIMPAVVLSIGYTIPMLPTQRTWYRFRDLPFAKPLIIAVVVSYLTLAFPVFEQMGITALFSPDFTSLYVERLLFLLAVTVPFEIRDVLRDDNEGISTLATRLGIVSTKFIGLVLVFGWMLAAGVAFVSFAFGWSGLIYLLVLATVLVTAYLRMNPGWSELNYVLVFEGLILIYSVFWSLMHVQDTAWIHPSAS